MKRVTGIGGVFLRAKDPAKLGAWYKAQVGIDVESWGGTTIRWADDDGAPLKGSTALSVGVGSSRVDLQACKLEYSIVSPK